MYLQQTNTDVTVQVVFMPRVSNRCHMCTASRGCTGTALGITQFVALYLESIGFYSFGLEAVVIGVK